MDSSPTIQSPEPLKLLIIDDDEEDFLIAREMLAAAKGRRWEVDWAATYEQGQKMLASDHYAAALVDYHLGTHSGLELVREAAAQDYPAPLILFTGRGSYEVDLEAMQAGATLYLNKSEVNPLLLERSIRYAMEMKHKERSLRESRDALRESEAALRQSSDALRKSEARERAERAELDAILDAVPAIVWVTHDPQAREVTGNWAAHAFLRVPAGENLSKSAPEGQAPRNFTVFKDGRELAPEELPLQITAATGEPIRDFEEDVVFEDGSRAHLLGNVTPLLDAHGRPAGAVGAFIDITRRKRALEALKVSEERLKTVIENLAEGLIVVDRTGEALHWNQAAMAMHGYEQHETELSFISILRNLYTLHSLDGQPLPFEQWPVARLLRGETFKDYVLVVSRTEQDWQRVFSYNGAPVFKPDGDFEIALLSVRDITERQRMESELQRTAEQLARSNRDLQNFAFIASHDLQEPLRKLVSFSDMLEKNLKENLEPENFDLLHRMQSAARRMQEMIRDLLDLSRVSTHRQPFERVDLNQAAAEVISDLENLIERTGGKVEVGSLPEIEADPRQMRQLLQNLLGNALKFHKPGTPPEVKVAASLEPARGAGTTCIRLEVRDNGIGFDQSSLETILQPFRRLHGRNEYEGTGIGLAICKQIVERHRGEISAESAPGEGAKFIVRLPVKQDAGRAMG